MWRQQVSSKEMSQWPYTNMSQWLYAWRPIADLIWKSMYSRGIVKQNELFFSLFFFGVRWGTLFCCDLWAQGMRLRSRMMVICVAMGQHCKVIHECALSQVHIHPDVTLGMATGLHAILICGYSINPNKRSYPPSEPHNFLIWGVLEFRHNIVLLLVMVMSAEM